MQAWIAIGFYLFILLTSNPFARLDPPPIDGRGLNPLLQDPGLAFHPPFLYLGYVGFSMAFSFAVAALIEGRVDASWARWVRPWTLAAWTFLTCGIALGSWWAYYELGWGGWWFWDPVENASLLPWLSGTALLHSAVVVEKRDALKGWTVFLAIVTFSLSLLGTFLVRSGVLTSVHAFAVDPARGVFILALLVIVIGGSFALFAWRGPQLPAGGLFRPISREGGLLLNNLLLCARPPPRCCSAPSIRCCWRRRAAARSRSAPPFFNAVFIPLMAPLVVAMAVGPLLPWKRGDLGAALGRLWAAALAAAGAALLGWAVYDARSVLGLLGLGLAAWLFVGTLIELAGRIGLFDGTARHQPAPRRRACRGPTWGMTLAHAGLAVAIAGMTASSVWKEERIQVMRPGDQRRRSPAIPFTFARRRARCRGPNYDALRGRFAVADRRRSRVATLTPERRFYPVEGQDTTEAAIRSTLAGDLYAVIGEPQGDGALRHPPLLQAAGRLDLERRRPDGAGRTDQPQSDRRHRVGAPARRRARPRRWPPAAGAE